MHTVFQKNPLNKWKITWQIVGKEMSKSGTSKNVNESVYRIPVWKLPFNLDVLREKFK